MNALLGKSAWKAFSNHLWYLVEEIMLLSLLSGAVTNKVKEEIFEKLTSVEDLTSFSSPQRNWIWKVKFSHPEQKC